MIQSDYTGDYLLMTPGPVQIPKQVLEVMSLPMIHHRTPEFEAILVDVLEKLKIVFHTERPVYIQACTGSGGMESALVNTLSPGDRVIAVVGGKFGERWRNMAQVFGMNVLTIDVPWGEAVDTEELEHLLKAHPETKAVLVQACETSTGVLNPIQEIAAITRKLPNTLLIVDAITALGVTPLAMAAWGLDVVVAASQKAFKLPTGLSFSSYSEKAWQFVESAKSHRYYFDIRKEHKANLSKQTQYSSAVSLIRGLQVVLNQITRQDLSANIEKFERLALATRTGAEKLGFQPFAEVPSPSVTSLFVPEGVDGNKIQRHMETKYRISIAGGQDHLKGKIIRIGHMGDVGAAEVKKTLLALGQTLCDLGHKVDPQAGVRAAEALL